MKGHVMRSSRDGGLAPAPVAKNVTLGLPPLPLPRCERWCSETVMLPLRRRCPAAIACLSTGDYTLNAAVQRNVARFSICHYGQSGRSMVMAFSRPAIRHCTWPTPDRSALFAHLAHRSSPCTTTLCPFAAFLHPSAPSSPLRRARKTATGPVPWTSLVGPDTRASTKRLGASGPNSPTLPVSYINCHFPLSV